MSELDRDARIEQLIRKAESLGLTSVRSISQATGVARETAKKLMERDPGLSDVKLRELEVKIEAFDEEGRSEVDDLAEPAAAVTYRVSGNFGVEVTVSGPVESIAELEASVTRLVEKMGRKD